jgi:chorismate dehydratase
VFSAVPVGQIRTLACDTDSHTSVALARILLAERYGVRPEFVPLDRVTARHGSPSPDTARLLIGDKVVCEEPAGLPHQLDLGEEWKHLTGLPFVFAAWMARPGVDLRDLPQRLESAKREGLEHVDEIVQRHAIPRGWPPGQARRYLTEYLKFDLGPRQFEAIRLFHRLAAEYGVIEACREVELHAAPTPPAA